MLQSGERVAKGSSSANFIVVESSSLFSKADVARVKPLAEGLEPKTRTFIFCLSALNLLANLLPVCLINEAKGKLEGLFAD